MLMFSILCVQMCTTWPSRIEYSSLLAKAIHYQFISFTKSSSHSSPHWFSLFACHFASVFGQSRRLQVVASVGLSRQCNLWGPLMTNHEAAVQPSHLEHRIFKTERSFCLYQSFKNTGPPWMYWSHFKLKKTRILEQNSYISRPKDRFSQATWFSRLIRKPVQRCFDNADNVFWTIQKKPSSINKHLIFILKPGVKSLDLWTNDNQSFGNWVKHWVSGYIFL